MWFCVSIIGHVVRVNLDRAEKCQNWQIQFDKPLAVRLNASTYATVFNQILSQKESFVRATLQDLVTSAGIKLLLRHSLPFAGKWHFMIYGKCGGVYVGGCPFSELRLIYTKFWHLDLFVWYPLDHNRVTVLRVLGSIPTVVANLANKIRRKPVIIMTTNHGSRT
jgi:hypothetical protein